MRTLLQRRGADTSWEPDERQLLAALIISGLVRELVLELCRRRTPQARLEVGPAKEPLPKWHADEHYLDGALHASVPHVHWPRTGGPLQLLGWPHDHDERCACGHIRALHRMDGCAGNSSCPCEGFLGG